MFWQQLNIEDSLINQLVIKEDCTLDRILAEDDVIQECKAKNEKLLDFLVRTENLHQLIDYIISEPTSEPNEKLKYYKSFVACELLTSDSNMITDKLANDDIIAAKLWSFIKNKGEINPLLASFFSKVVQLLINRRPNSILEFLKDDISLIDDLIRHVNTSAIMDLIYRIVICFETSITRFKVCHWLRDVRLIEKLVALISSQTPSDKLCNTCQLLSEIIKVCRDPQDSFKGAKDALLLELEQDHTIKCVVDNVLQAPKEEVTEYGVGVLLSYLIKPNPTSMAPNMEVEGPSLVILDSFIDCLAENIERMQVLLIRKSPTLGMDRLQVVRLYSLLIQCYNPDINNKMVRLRSLDILWGLFLQYPYNNFLHTQIAQIIDHVLNTKVSEHEDGVLLNYLIREFKLLNKLVLCWEDELSTANDTSVKTRRKGYMGHLFNISINVQSVMDGKDNKDVILNWIHDQEDKGFWDDFFTGPIKVQCDKNECDLVPDPMNTTESDDDDRIGPNYTLQKVFSRQDEMRIEEVDWDLNIREHKIGETNLFDDKMETTETWQEKHLSYVPMQLINQISTDSSSSEEDENDPWAVPSPNHKETVDAKDEFTKMDSDTSWANFSNFETPPTGPNDDWTSTDGKILKAQGADDWASAMSDKYTAPGGAYVESKVENGVNGEDIKTVAESEASSPT